ncbi:hypothetical protein HMPREF1529_00677 [Microbacterium sp. oral taxon 186 str. F0373]|uniref:alpha/beta hydrolase n=1 Tax=Microbacterium sp. oral taxon 186 TaxID=712383 RepID=UPI00034E9E38|nr:alpha/beta hydrolase [Microbacterium sp. oral taxon 186]EPD86077.1 hypothetical protein HMPREF1529_00677 [Microbacterium sp. oral taxon 186 str. F0373]
MSLPGIDADPSVGDPSAIRALAAVFDGRSLDLNDRGSDVGVALTEITATSSSTSSALAARTMLLHQRFGEASAGSAEVSRVLRDYAAALEGLQEQAQRRLSSASAAYDQLQRRRREAMNEASEFIAGWAVPWDGVLPRSLYLSDPSYLVRWQSAIDEYKDRARLYNELHADRQSIDDRAARNLRAIDLVAAVTHAGAVGAGGLVAATTAWAGDLSGLTASSIASLGDPAAIREVWNALDQTQREQLIAAAPLVIGNLNGIPIRDRVAANRINIRNEITRQEQLIQDWERLKADTRGYPGGGPAAYDALIRQAQSTIDYYRDELLDREITWIDDKGGIHREIGARVVVFDPSKDAIATYHGPLDPATGDIPAWVKNVAVSVPGTTTTMTNFSDGVAKNLQAAAGPDSAVFQWAGGRFPHDIPEAMTWGYAETLAPRLRDFVAGIDMPAGATSTVLGHSYGGATVGLAEKDGLSADRVLYVSAAGMGHGVSGVEDFPNTSNVPHYSMMARNDAVVGAIQPGIMDWMHGQSALTADDVTRLETGWIHHDDPNSADLEDYNEPGNGTPPAIDAHSSVFAPDSTAFHNMVAVITGGEAVVFAPDKTATTGRTAYTMDGIDVPGYTPEYVKTK